MLQYSKEAPPASGIAIIGVGGGGANVLKCFNASSADNIRLYIMSLDERLSQSCGNVQFIQLGEGISHGLGSGGDPDVGKQAMQESEQRVRQALEGCKLVVMVVGLGGGTGSGAGPVLARIVKESGVFLVCVVMMPFSFEGKRRREQATEAFEQVSRLADIVLCFENDYMEELFRDRSGAREVFEEVNRLLAKATAAIPMMATSPGLINLGLDELAAALENSDSRCIFGSGSGYGVERAKQAATAAVESPLMCYHGALRFARTAIVHIAGNDKLSISEVRKAMETVQRSFGSDDVRIFFGTAVKASLGEEVRVTLIASIDAEEFKAACAAAPVPERPSESSREQPAPTEPTPQQPQLPEDEAEELSPSGDAPEEEVSHDSGDVTESSDSEHSSADDAAAPADAGDASSENSEEGVGETDAASDDTRQVPRTEPSSKKRQLNLFQDPATPAYGGQGARDEVRPGAGAQVHSTRGATSATLPYRRGTSAAFTDPLIDGTTPVDDIDTPPSLRSNNTYDPFSES